MQLTIPAVMHLVLEKMVTSVNSLALHMKCHSVSLVQPSLLFESPLIFISTFINADFFFLPPLMILSDFRSIFT